MPQPPLPKPANPLTALKGATSIGPDPIGPSNWQYGAIGMPPTGGPILSTLRDLYGLDQEGSMASAFGTPQSTPGEQSIIERINDSPAISKAMDYMSKTGPEQALEGLKNKIYNAGAKGEALGNKVISHLFPVLFGK